MPESFECQSNLMFRIHVSTHLSKQPSEVRLKGGKARTQDVILCKVVQNDRPLCHHLLTEEFHNMPCIVIGDTDTGTNLTDWQSKETLLQRDMILRVRCSSADGITPS